MIVEDKYFIRNDGTERHLKDIVNERIEIIQNNRYEGLTTVNDFFPIGENYHQVVVSSLIQYDLEYFFEGANGKNRLQYATGDILDDIGAQKGVFRHDAEFAIDTVVFSLPKALTSPVTILEGTEVCTEDSIIFLTNEDVTISTGEISVVCESICEESGSIGNVKAGSINIILTSLPYDLSVTNPNDIVSGVDEEDDDTFKERIRNSHSPGLSIWYEEVAETLVKDALYHKISTTQGLIVYKPTEGVTETDLVNLFSQKENQIVNIDLNFQEGVSKNVIDTSKSITVVTRDGYTLGVVRNKIINVINKYVDELGLGEVFKPICIQFLCENIEGVDYVQLNGYVEVDLTNKEYASINGDLVVNQG